MIQSLAASSRLALLSAAAQLTSHIAAELRVTGEAKAPPEWVRLLAPGENKARDGRSYVVDDVDQVVARSLEYKGGIDLLLDFEHQFDRAHLNGHPAPAAGWITDIAAKGPDGSPGIWARMRWLPETAAMIQSERYRYLSAVITHAGDNVVQMVVRAALTNHPALDTTTALFSAQQQQVVPLSVHNQALDQIAAQAAQRKSDLLDAASKSGRLPPALRAVAEKLPADLLTEFLSALPVIVVPGEAPATVNPTTLAAPGTVTIETLSAEHKAEAKRYGVSEEAYVVALNNQLAQG